MTKKHKERVKEQAQKEHKAAKISAKRALIFGLGAIVLAAGVFFLVMKVRGGGEADDSPFVGVDPGIALTEDGKLPWNLIVVSRDSLLPRDFTLDLEKVAGYRVDTRIAEPLRALIAAAGADDVELSLCSGYRSVSKQTELYDKEVEDNKRQGHDETESRRLAEQFIQSPGASEHHTGLAVDIITPSYQTLDSGFADTAAAQWLVKNASKYGFILRYPEDKVDITGILYEPWHYRFVGTEAAGQMEKKGLCLEEFTQTLKPEK